MPQLRNEQVFHTGITRAEKKHGGHVNEDLLRLLIEKIYEKKEEMLFWEAVRYSLNELHIWNYKRRVNLIRETSTKVPQVPISHKFPDSRGVHKRPQASQKKLRSSLQALLDQSYSKKEGSTPSNCSGMSTNHTTTLLYFAFKTNPKGFFSQRPA